MPIVHREGPFVFQIWPADHAPPHVHVYNGDGMCVIEIETGYVRRDSGMRGPDIYAAVRIVLRNQEKLLAEWRRLHGV
jgi:hypothetical protein